MKAILNKRVLKSLLNVEREGANFRELKEGQNLGATTPMSLGSDTSRLSLKKEGIETMLMDNDLVFILQGHRCSL